MKGRSQFKDRFLSLKTIDTWIEYVCHSEGEFERGMVVGAKRTGWSVSIAATLPGFSSSTVSRVSQEWSTTQRTSTQPDNCGMQCSQHGPASLWNAFNTL
jgi:hypothetical protein